MDLKIGDVVALASGGPPMTVCQAPFKTIDGKTHPTKVECKWIDENNRLKHSIFDINELIKK